MSSEVSVALDTMYLLNLQIRIVDIIILLIIWILYLKNKRLPFEEGRFFVFTLVALSINIVLDVLTTYNIYHYDTIVKLSYNIVERLFLFTICLSMYFLHMHIVCLCVKSKTQGDAKNILALMPILLVSMIIIFADINFNMDMDGAYLYGPAVNVAFFVMLVYFIMSLICVLFNKRHLSVKRKRNLVLGLTVWAGFGILQAVIPVIPLSGTGLIILMLMNFLNFEDSKVYINYENGCFNSMAYRKMVNSYFNKGSVFYVAQVGFYEFDIVHGQYGHDVCQHILKKIGEIVEEILHTKIYSVEEEVIGIILEKEEFDEEKLRNLADKLEYDYKINESIIHITGIIDLIQCPYEASDITELEGIFKFMNMDKDREQNFYKYDRRVVKQKERYADVLRILENAINNDGFYMVYQPIYSVKDKNFHSAEALIRLKDTRTIGFISPEEFIPVAEKEGLIMKIGEIVISKVCEFAQREQLLSKGIEYIEVNLSAVQCIDRGLADQIKGAAQSHGLPCRFLNLEITETAAVSSGNMLNRNVEVLRGMGATFSMDDFGTGYSNLSQMVDVPYEIIKIDKSLIWCCYPEQRKILVEKIETEEVMKEAINKSMAVLTKIIELINDLKIKIVAEGVETKEMVDVLSEKGVDYLQGYYFSKPLIEDEFVNFIDASKV